jgi:hypothetical protein
MEQGVIAARAARSLPKSLRKLTISQSTEQNSARLAELKTPADEVRCPGFRALQSRPHRFDSGRRLVLPGNRGLLSRQPLFRRQVSAKVPRRRKKPTTSACFGAPPSPPGPSVDDQHAAPAVRRSTRRARVIADPCAHGLYMSLRPHRGIGRGTLIISLKRLQALIGESPRQARGRRLSGPRRVRATRQRDDGRLVGSPGRSSGRGLLCNSSELH